MSGKRVKEGILRRYKSRLLGGKWVESKVVLYQDSTLIWYEDKNEGNPIGHILLKDLAPYFAVGPYSARLPNRPQLPTGAKIDHVLAFGTGASRDAKVHWFLCYNDEDVNSWMSSIVSTLPPPPPQPPPQQPPPQQMPPAGYNQGGPPPGYYPSQPPAYGQHQPPQGAWNPNGGYPRQPMTTTPASHTTVVMAPSTPAYSGGSGLGYGAAGLGTGMLAGGLMGYAMGSMMHPHYGYGGGWGYGGGYGYGPGGYSDNDTTIVNNYNYNNTTNNDTNTFNDNNGDTFDYGGDNTGMDDFSAGDDFDFGGGDFGGDF